MKQALKTTAIILHFIFIFVGAASTIVLLHETYHLIDLEGDPTGICFGKCYVGGVYGEFAPAGVHWASLSNEYIDSPERNEIEAWIFSITITLILFTIYSIYYPLNKK